MSDTVNDGQGGGSRVDNILATAASATPNGEGAVTAPGGDGMQAAPPAAPATPQVVSLDPDTIKTLVSGIVPAVQQPTAPAQPTMTQEELERRLNVYRVNEQDLQTLGYPAEVLPQAAQFHNKFAEGAVRWASTLAAVQVAQMRQQLMQELGPMVKFAQEAQERQLREEFIGQNEDLKGYEPLLEALYTQLKAQGTSFPSKEAAFKTIATLARQTIAKLPGQGGGGAASTTGSAKTKMATVTTGGQSGSGGGKGAAMPAPQALARKLFFNSRP